MVRCSCSGNTHAHAKNPLRQNYCNENLECHHNISSNRNEYVNVSSMFRRASLVNLRRSYTVLYSTSKRFRNNLQETLQNVTSLTMQVEFLK